MELRHLRYFIAVAEELHFGRAAERLHIAQPPLSQQIRGLEAELGVLLFQRTKRRVQLTEAGRLFLDEARRVIAQADHAVRVAQRAHRGELGHLVVGFVGSATASVLPDILLAFRTQFPEVSLSLQEMTTTQQLRALHEERIHLGFLRPPIDDEHLALEIILQEPLLVVLPQSHVLARRRRIPLRALAREPIVLPPRELGPGFQDQIVGLCQRAGFSPQIIQEAVQMQTVVGLVAAGMGVSLVPASVQTLRRHGVVYRSLQASSPRVDLAVAWRRGDPSVVVHTFLDVVRGVTQTV